MGVRACSLLSVGVVRQHPLARSSVRSTGSASHRPKSSTSCRHCPPSDQQSSGASRMLYDTRYRSSVWPAVHLCCAGRSWPCQTAPRRYCLLPLMSATDVTSHRLGSLTTLARLRLTFGFLALLDGVRRPLATVQVASRLTDHRQAPAPSALPCERATPGLRTSHVFHPRSRPSCGRVQDCWAMCSLGGAQLRAAVHGGPGRLLGGARFPTVGVGPGASDGAVHLRSSTAGRGSGYRLRSRLNGRERR